MLRLARDAFKTQSIMFEQALKFFVVFFVVVDPVSLIPLFTGLTVGANTSFKRRMAYYRFTSGEANSTIRLHRPVYADQ